MTSHSEVELQRLVSHIASGESHLGQLRQALDEPLLKRWNLATYRDIPKTSQGSTLFAWAIQNKNTIALELIMKNLGLEYLPEDLPVEIRSEEKSNMLYTAVEYYHEPTWKFVLQRVDTNRVYEQLGLAKNTVLHAAAKRSIADMFRSLHDKVGNTLKDKLLKTRDGQGQTVLHVAASRLAYDGNSLERCYDTVLELLKIQPRLIEVQDRNGETVFHKAVVANQKRVLQHLLEMDARVLSKCDRYHNSAYSFFQKKSSKSDYIRAISSKDVESFRGVSRTPSFDAEIGSILRRAILGLDNLSISERRQLLFKDGAFSMFMLLLM